MPVAPPPTDHFTCYTVKRSRGGLKFVKRTVSVANQFETVTLELQKPARLCAPASKNGEDPTAPSHPDHLPCYKARSKAKFGTIDVAIDNQFGPDQVTLIHRRELCVPALKNPNGPPSGAFLEATSPARWRSPGQLPGRRGERHSAPGACPPPRRPARRRAGVRSR